MNADINGKKIAAVYWPNNVGQYGRHMVSSSPYETLHFQKGWIVLTRDGVELERHNARFVETIVWA